MPAVLAASRYGKAEIRVVRVTKDGPLHSIKDVNVSIALSGNLAATYLTGDNADVLPTDTMKNTCLAFAQNHGIGEIEEYAQLLARHFVTTSEQIHRARVAVDEYLWDRIGDTGHSFAKSRSQTRTCVATFDGHGFDVISGLRDLAVFNSTGSEFWGFPRDEYTTLPEVRDRAMATVIDAQWRHETRNPANPIDWARSYDRARAALLEAFADTHSFSLQQTLFAMGEHVIERCPEICEVRLRLPNNHHFLADLTPFGLKNDNETLIVSDRPYGLIEGTVLREGAPDAALAWD
jgi:urate oxidase